MTQLPTAVLGRTGLEITRLGYGAAHLKPMDDIQRERIHHAVLDAGINYIDTAGCYGNSEERIGRYLSGRRSEFYLATKCGCSRSGERWTRDAVFGDLHRSLRRLKSDYVDVMQPHNPSVEACESGGVVDSLVDMRDQGKVRWIGISTTLPYLPTYLSWGVFDVFQVPYSALERDHEGWITKAAEAGIGIVVRGGVAHGEPGVGKGDLARWAKFEDAKLDELREAGESRTALMLRHTLTHPHSNTNIVGTTNTDHLRENVEAMSRGPLSSDVYAEAQRRLTKAGVVPDTVA